VITPRNDLTPTRPTDLLCRREVAVRFGVTPQTISRWASQGIIPYVRTLGGQRRYPAYEIERLMSAAWEHGLPGSTPAFGQRRNQSKGGTDE
jgi:excisionase family DNA binding protein